MSWHEEPCVTQGSKTQGEGGQEGIEDDTDEDIPDKRLEEGASKAKETPNENKTHCARRRTMGKTTQSYKTGETRSSSN